MISFITETEQKFDLILKTSVLHLFEHHSSACLYSCNILLIKLKSLISENIPAMPYFRCQSVLSHVLTILYRAVKINKKN